MKYKLAIFDLDGTILNTLEDLTCSLNAALACSALPPRSRDEVRLFAGNGIRKLVERGVPSGTPDAVTERVFADFVAHYRLHCADHTKPYAGIEELLAALREQGCMLAVVSNKADFAVQTLCEKYFPNTFDAVAGERAGVRKKPAPDTVNAVLARLGASREEAVYIGDSEVDIETAKHAEMDCISVDWGFRTRAALLQAGAKRIASSPREILAAMEE